MDILIFDPLVGSPGQVPSPSDESRGVQLVEVSKGGDQFVQETSDILL